MSDEHFNRGSYFSLSTSIHLVRWGPPPPGSVKTNFDRSLINSLASDGCVLHDWTSKLFNATGAAYYASIFVVEVRVLRDGVNAAIQANFNNICVEGDNLIVIQAPKENILISWQISDIIEDVPT